MSRFSRFFNSKPKPTPGPRKRVMDLGNDPLNPHGDGTIRKGDPLFDLMTGGKAMIAKRGEDGNWEVDIVPDDEK